MPVVKHLLYSSEARKKLKAGVDAVANAVITTLGPKGRNVAIERMYGIPHIVHDGVTVAREVSLKDPFENLGAQMMKEASSRTNDVAGDGTTTSMVIAQAVVTEGLKNVEAGSNPMLLKSGIEEAVKIVETFLKELATPVTTKEEMKNVAKISAASEEIGTMVADALEKVGREGTLTAEEDVSQTGLSLEVKDGMEIQGGYVSPYFVTNRERLEAEINDCAVVVTDRKINSVNEIVPFLNKMVASGKNNIVIIAAEVEEHALATLVVNHLQGKIKALAIKAPRSGDRQRDILEDIASLVGAKVISQEQGTTLATSGPENYGFAKKIISNRESTIIVADKSENTSNRIEVLKNLKAEAKTPYEAERYEERLAKLQGGVAVINVGGSTEVEMKERIERVKDAIGATKAALDEGIVAGGGVALLMASVALRMKMMSDYGDSRTELLGMEIVAKACEKPLWCLVNNAGLKADHIVEQVKSINDIASMEKGRETGYNVMSNEYEIMIKSGVIDPVKVVRHEILHGCSCAMMLLTTECVIIEDREELAKVEK